MNRTCRILALCGALASACTTAAQGPGLHTLMREKLTRTQKILEAVVTSDWVGLETESRELERLTRDPRWMVLKYPEYGQQTEAFVRAIKALHTAAAQRDLEATPRAYVDLTLQCVACHRYLARQRTAK
jgi:hypothetical protein